MLLDFEMNAKLSDFGLADVTSTVNRSTGGSYCSKARIRVGKAVKQSADSMV